MIDYHYHSAYDHNLPRSYPSFGWPFPWPTLATENQPLVDDLHGFWLGVPSSKLTLLLKLVGGLEHFLFSIIYGIILPIDWYVSRWLKPPARNIGYEKLIKLWFSKVTLVYQGLNLQKESPFLFAGTWRKKMSPLGIPICFVGEIPGSPNCLVVWKMNGLFFHMPGLVNVQKTMKNHHALEIY